MPCTGLPHECCGGQNHTEVVYKESPENTKIIEELLVKNNQLEAGLCAIISELEKEGDVDDLLARAGKKGQIDLIGFWFKHRNSDEMRLARELNKFSQHEQAILKKLLTNSNV